MKFQGKLSQRDKVIDDNVRGNMTEEFGVLFHNGSFKLSSIWQPPYTLETLDGKKLTISPWFENGRDNKIATFIIEPAKEDAEQPQPSESPSDTQ